MRNKRTGPWSQPCGLSGSKVNWKANALSEEGPFSPDGLPGRYVGSGLPDLGFFFFSEDVFNVYFYMKSHTFQILTTNMENILTVCDKQSPTAGYPFGTSDLQFYFILFYWERIYIYVQGGEKKIISTQYYYSIFNLGEVS